MNTCLSTQDMELTTEQSKNSIKVQLGESMNCTCSLQEWAWHLKTTKFHMVCESWKSWACYRISGSSTHCHFQESHWSLSLLSNLFVCLCFSFCYTGLCSSTSLRSLLQVLAHCICWAVYRPSEATQFHEFPEVNELFDFWVLRGFFVRWEVTHP